jgi:hypothetical protein
LSQITHSLRDFMDAHRYQYTDVGDDCYRLHFTGKNGAYDLFASASEERGQVIVSTYCAVYVPEPKRTLVADFLNRVNFGLFLGCLEMDADDGRIRARSSCPVGDEQAFPSFLLRSLFDSSFFALDNWLPGILRVAFGSDDPRTAFDATLAALAGETVEQPEAEAELNDSTTDSAPDLTAIEEEVARLLAERDGEADSPA